MKKIFITYAVFFKIYHKMQSVWNIYEKSSEKKTFFSRIEVFNY